MDRQETIGSMNMKKISAFDMVCVVLSVVPWLCLLYPQIAVHFMNNGDVDYFKSNAVFVVSSFLSNIVYAYIYTYWIFIVIVMYNLIKGKSNTIVSVLTVISHILFVIVWVSILYKVIASF